MQYVLIALILGVLFYFAFRQDLEITHYSLASNKLPLGRSLRLVVVSDLHDKVYGKDQKKLSEMIIAQHPTAILYPGDIINDRGKERGARMLVKALHGRVPGFYVTGNHEYRFGRAQIAKKLMKDHGITVLEDQAVEMTLGGFPIVLAGVEDAGRCSEDPSYDFDTALVEVGEQAAQLDGYKILLVHHPEKINEFRQLDFDLVISGHAHGGQWRIPGLLHGLYAPDQGIFPRYAGGLYVYDDINHIVSRGLANNHNLVPRIFNRPELVVVDIHGNNRENAV